VDAGRIVAVGPAGEIPVPNDAKEVINIKGRTLMPGMIDMHTHIIHWTFRGQSSSSLRRDPLADIDAITRSLIQAGEVGKVRISLNQPFDLLDVIARH
jgi:imidazolonepropionase-like amidohydrolase